MSGEKKTPSPGPAAETVNFETMLRDSRWRKALEKCGFSTDERQPDPVPEKNPRD